MLKNKKKIMIIITVIIIKGGVKWLLFLVCAFTFEVVHDCNLTLWHVKVMLTFPQTCSQSQFWIN